MLRMYGEEETDVRVLVTGGCGFIGRHLCTRLIADGHTVRVLDDLSTGQRDLLPDGAELVVGDVARAGDVDAAMAAVDRCVHLAAIASVPQCQADWTRASSVNLIGTVNVLAAAARHDSVPVVYASSAAVYGPATPPCREDATPEPLSNYGVDKLASEWQARVAGRTTGVPTFGLRFFNVFGPGQDPSSPYSGVITHFATALTDGRRPVIYGSGEQTRDFVFVGDVVEAIDLAMAHADVQAPVVNVCTGQAIDLITLVREMATIMAKDPTVEHAPARVGDIVHSRGDASKAAEALGFRARTTLRAGLRDLLIPGR